MCVKIRKTYKKSKVTINTESRMAVVRVDGGRKTVWEGHNDLSPSSHFSQCVLV